MALFKNRAMKKDTANKREYLKYYKANKPDVKTYAEWKKAKIKPVSKMPLKKFKKKETLRTKDISSSLSKAGLSKKEIERLRGGK